MFLCGPSDRVNSYPGQDDARSDATQGSRNAKTELLEAVCLAHFNFTGILQPKVRAGTMIETSASPILIFTRQLTLGPGDPGNHLHRE